MFNFQFIFREFQQAEELLTKALTNAEKYYGLPTFHFGNFYVFKNIVY